MKIKRVFLFVIVSILILGLAPGAAAAVNSPVGQGSAPEPPEATGSRSGTPDTTQAVVYESPASFSEGFDDITILPGLGWFMQNNSAPLGVTNWFQGNNGVFPAHAGAPTAYIGANYNNTSGVGTISNWLLTPEQVLNNGATFSFWTRTATGSTYPDRLQVRLSMAGASTNVGTAAEDVGDFTTLILDVNPNLVLGGYPVVWTQYTVTLSGIPDGSSGRLAFRYYVTNAGPSGSNSDYIGIDTVEFTGPPSITLSKTVGIDPLTCAITDAITVTVGTEATYCYEVTNTGESTLNLHDLVDTELGIILDDFTYVLISNASVFLTQTVTINATTVNTATWTARAMTPIAFYDISSSGTPLNLTDDSEANVVIPFPFTYFGATSTDLRVGNNGGLLFGVTTGDVGVSNASLPNAGLSAPAILPFWDDLDSDTGNVYYTTLGTAPKRMFIVEWYNRPHYSNTGSATLEVILYEGSNAIEFLYLDTDFGNALYDFGASATSGLQESSSSAVQYSYTQPILYNEFGLHFSPPDYLPQPLDGAVATATATVNVVIPEIDIAPTSLESLQLTNHVVSKTLTISNLGDPMTSLDWMVLESQSVEKSAGSVSTGSGQIGQQSPDSVAEVVGVTVPQDVTSVPSIIGLHSNPFMPTDVVYDNGPLVTHPGGGAGGADASALQSALAMNTYGFGNQVSANNRVADDFTVTNAGGWQIDTITFYSYQTGSGTGSTITAVNLQIWDGVPGNPGSNVVWGDTTTNVLVNTTWSNIYRVLDTNMLNATRPVMADTVTVDTHLEPGTYWLDWQTDGTLASGPWVSPISILGQTITGNARQYTPSSGAWADLVDTGTFTPQGLPFVIEGSVGGCVGDIPWATVDPISGTLPGGDSTLVEVNFDSTSLVKGVYTGTLCVISNDPDEGLTTVPITLTVVSGSDLAVTKSDIVDPVRVGDLITYNLVVTNHGPDATTGVMLEDAMPSSVTFVSASAGCTHVGSMVTCDIGDMTTDEIVTLSIVVTADAVGTATNTAEIWSDVPDPDPLNNIASEDTLIKPAMSYFYLPIVQKH